MGNSQTSHTNVDPQTLTANLDFISKKHDPRYGQISLYADKNTKETVVLKEIYSKSTQEFKDEIANLTARCTTNPEASSEEESRGLNTPNLLKVLAFATQAQDNLCTSFYKILVVLEYLEQDLEREIASHKSNGQFYTEEQIWYLLESLISALSALHRENVVLGDIKPSTVFISSLGVYKVADPSLIGSASMPGYTQRLSGVTDIRTYLSPQLLKSLADQELQPKHDAAKSDVFAAGLTVLHAAGLSNCDGFYDYDQNTFDQEGLRNRIDSLSERYSQRLRDYIARLLVIEESERPNATELSHELTQIRWRETLKTNNQESAEVVTSTQHHTTTHHTTTHHKFNSAAPEEYNAEDQSRQNHAGHENYVEAQLQTNQAVDVNQILDEYRNKSTGLANAEASTDAHASNEVAYAEASHSGAIHAETTESAINNQGTTSQQDQSYTTQAGATYQPATTAESKTAGQTANSQPANTETHNETSAQSNTNNYSAGTTGTNYTKTAGYVPTVGTNYSSNYGTTGAASYSSPTRTYGNYTTGTAAGATNTGAVYGSYTTGTTAGAATTGATTAGATTTGAAYGSYTTGTTAGTATTGVATTGAVTTGAATTGVAVGTSSYGSYLTKYQPLSTAAAGQYTSSYDSKTLSSPERKPNTTASSTVEAQNVDSPSKYVYKPSSDVEKIINEVKNKSEVSSTNYTSNYPASSYKASEGTSAYTGLSSGVAGATSTGATGAASTTSTGAAGSYVSTYKLGEGQYKTGEAYSPYKAGQTATAGATQGASSYSSTYKPTEQGSVTTTNSYAYNPDSSVKSILDQYKNKIDPTNAEKEVELDFIPGASVATDINVNANVDSNIVASADANAEA